MGWLGEDSGQWAILVTDPNQALPLESYPYNGTNYYRIKGTDRYMSVSDTAYIGFYSWLGATGFKLQGTHLVSDYNGQSLSFFSLENGYLYAWNAYNVLNVKLEPIIKSVIANQPLTAQIEHVVVLMLENRSFDNMLGGLYPEETRAGLYRGLKGDESDPLDPNNLGEGSVTVFQGPAADGTWIMPYPDPGELFDDMNEQITCPTYSRSSVPFPPSTSLRTGFTTRCRNAIITSCAATQRLSYSLLPGRLADREASPLRNGVRYGEIAFNTRFECKRNNHAQSHTPNRTDK